VEAINFKQVFQDLKKDEELSAITKLILPKYALPSSMQFKKKEKTTS
jgi:hypothetical protein